MEQEEVVVINIKTDQSITTVKELKKYIEELRDDLVKVDKDSEEYTKTLQEVAKAQTKLTEVTRDAKNAINYNTGSYRELNQELVNLRNDYKSLTEEQRNNAEVGGKMLARIQELDAELKSIDATMGNYQRQVGHYQLALEALNKDYATQREELSALKKALDVLDPSTKEYIQAFNRASEITSNLATQQEMLKYSSKDLGDQLSNIRGIATNMIAGFSAVNAAMGLFGEESEDVQKAMLKVQQAMALVQGLQGVDGFIKRTKGLSAAMKEWTTATKTQTTATNAQTVATNTATVAQKGLNAAMKANPVGLIIVAVTTLVALFTKFKKQILDFVGGAEKVNNVLAKMKASFLGIVNVIGKQLLVPLKEVINYFKTIGNVIGDVFTGNWKKIGEDIKNGLQNTVDIVKDGYNVLENYNEAYNASIEKSNTKAERERANARAKELEDVIATNDAKYDSDWKYTESGKAIYEEYLQAKIKSYKADSKEYKAAVNDKLKYDREFAEKQQKQAEDAEKKEKERREKAKKAAEDYKKQIETVEKNYQTQIQKTYGNSVRETVNSYKETLKTFKDELTLQLKIEKDPETIKNIKSAIKEINNELKDVEGINIFKMEDINGTLDLLTKSYRAKFNDAIKNSADENKQRVHDEIVKLFEKTIQPDINTELAKLQLDTSKKTIDLDYQINFGDETKIQENEIEKVKVKYENLNQELELQLDHYKQITDFVEENNLTPSKEYDEAKRKLVELENKQKEVEISRRKELNDINTKYFNKELANVQAQTDALLKGITDSFQQAHIDDNWYKMLQPVSIKEEQKYLDDIYNTQLEGLTKIKDLWKARANDETLTNEERIEARKEAAIAEINVADLVLQHQIENAEKEKELWQQRIDIVQNSVTSIGNLFGSIASVYEQNIEAQVKANKMSDKEADKQFERVKALRVAEAVMNTLAGSIGAFMQASATYPAPYGQIIGGITAAAVTAAGVAQIQQIRNSSRSSAGGSSSAAAPTPTVTEMPVTYTQNVTNESDVDALRNAVRDGMQEVNISVSVTEIDEAQNKVKTREKESSF